MLSSTGRCHSWDKYADGYLRGEGCGVVILEKNRVIDCSDVIENPPRFYANILATGVAQDGASATITAPNGTAQASLINKTLAKANIEGRKVSYIEGHGTGTPLGDPIEVNSIAEVFGPTRTPENPLYIGSVKSNIGHLEMGAGIAGLIDGVLALQNESAPPNAGLTSLNPQITEICNKVPGALQFPTKLTSLRDSQNNAQPLIAGISSFGYSGTIAHTIITQAAPETRRKDLTTSYPRLDSAAEDHQF